MSRKLMGMPPGRIVPVEARHLAACEAFIARREWSCVPLSEKFAAFKGESLISPEKAAAGRASEFFMLAEAAGEEREEARIAGVLFVSRGGNVLHCISPRALKSRAWRQEIKLFFKGRKIASIMGERDANRFLEKICGALFFQKTDYIFMRKLRNGGGEALAPKSACAARGAAVCACSRKDAEELLPLQIAYEAEEMGSHGGEAESGKALMRLKAALARQTIVACRDALTGRLLGKAGTNAKGIGWNQIGGVYTLPLERGRGIAAFMVAELALLSAAEGKDAVLFVKPGNKAARRAYEKSGFKECGAFRVAARGI